MKIGGSLVTAVLMLLLFAGMLILALDWPEEARGFPFLIAIGGIVFSVWLIISMVIGMKSQSAEENATKERLPAGTGGMLLWLVLLCGVTIIFGFWVGSILFMVAFLRRFGRESWSTSIGVTATLMAILFFTLSVALKIPIYGGVLKLTPF